MTGCRGGGRQTGMWRRAKLSLRLTKHHAMKTYEGVEVYLHVLLTSALDGMSGKPHSLTVGKEPPVPNT